MNAAVFLSDLKKSFFKTEILKGINFSVDPGEIFGLIGHDGSGKTTILRILSGVYRPDSGEVAIFDLNVKKDIQKIKPRLGYMSQTFGLYPDLTVEENLDFFADIFGVDEKNKTEKKAQILEFSRLDHFRKRQARYLSGGIYKKLALGCTLIHNPDLLLLDEPTAGVDPVSRQEFWKIIGSIHSQTTIIVTTHYMEEAAKCDRVALLYQGKIIECDRPAELLKKFPQKIYAFKYPNPFELFQFLRD